MPSPQDSVGQFSRAGKLKEIATPPVPALMKNAAHELQGGDRADGGHVHTAGEVSISNKAVFKAGFARAGVRSYVCTLSVVYVVCTYCLQIFAVYLSIVALSCT